MFNDTPAQTNTSGTEGETSKVFTSKGNSSRCMKRSNVYDRCGVVIDRNH